jgi:hypothetical protein
MNQELKTLFAILSQFIKAINCDKAIFDFSYDGEVYYKNKMRCGGEYINIPIEITPYLENYLENLPDFRGDSSNGSEYHGYEMIFEPKNMRVVTYGQYTEYDTESGGSSSMKIPKEVLSQFQELISEGYTQPFYVDFSGGGDSGYIEDSGSDYENKNFTLTPDMDNLGYQVLSNFGGWEINEGSQGQIVFNIEEKEVTCDLTWNVENTETEEIDIWNINR